MEAGMSERWYDVSVGPGTLIAELVGRASRPTLTPGCACFRQYCLSLEMKTSKKIYLHSTTTSSLHCHLDLTYQFILQHTLLGQFQIILSDIAKYKMKKNVSNS